MIAIIVFQNTQLKAWGEMFHVVLAVRGLFMASVSDLPFVSVCCCMCLSFCISTISFLNLYLLCVSVLIILLWQFSRTRMQCTCQMVLHWPFRFHPLDTIILSTLSITHGLLCEQTSRSMCYLSFRKLAVPVFMCVCVCQYSCVTSFVCTNIIPHCSDSMFVV